MIRPNHILLLNVFFAPHSFGGATVVAEAVARVLMRDHGIRISTVSAMHRRDLPPYSVMKTQSDRIDSYLINLPPGRSYTEVYDNPRVTALVGDLLDQLAPDLVHAHCLQDLGIGVLGAVRRRDLPLVLSTHDFWWLCERQFMIRPNRHYCGQNPVQIAACRGCVAELPRAQTRFQALQKAAAQADLITFPSRFAHDLSQRSGLTAPRLAVWENGITGPEPEFFETQAARRAVDPTLVFGYLGGVTQVKGWPLIRAAFEMLDRDDLAGWLVDLSLNGDEWNGQKIDRMRGIWRIHPRFERAGMDEFYAKIDVLLFPSQWKETFGLTVREAAARGIHVLQTDCGGAAEWDGAKRSEMLRIGDGPEILSAHIKRLLKDRPAPPKPRHFANPVDQTDAFLKLIRQI